MEQTRGYTGDHKSWTGDPCKECGKNHPSWVHKPVSPVQTARKVMSEQMRATAYVISHPMKYNKDRREKSMALLELRIAEYEVAVEQRTVERLGRLVAKHTVRDDKDLAELGAAKRWYEACQKSAVKIDAATKEELS